MLKNIKDSKHFKKNVIEDHLLKGKNHDSTHGSDEKLNVQNLRHDDILSKHAGKIFGILTMPNGQRIRTMREDAFRAALAAIRPARAGTTR